MAATNVDGTWTRDAEQKSVAPGLVISRSRRGSTDATADRRGVGPPAEERNMDHVQHVYDMFIGLLRGGNSPEQAETVIRGLVPDDATVSAAVERYRADRRESDHGPRARGTRGQDENRPWYTGARPGDLFWPALARKSSRATASTRPHCVSSTWHPRRSSPTSRLPGRPSSAGGPGARLRAERQDLELHRRDFEGGGRRVPAVHRPLRDPQQPPTSDAAQARGAARRAEPEPVGRADVRHRRLRDTLETPTPCFPRTSCGSSPLSRRTSSDCGTSSNGCSRRPRRPGGTAPSWSSTMRLTRRA